MIINIYTCCSYNNHDKTSTFFYIGMAVVDVLNYSDLRIKQDVSIEVVDRYGAPVYKSKDQIIPGMESRGPASFYWNILVYY